MSKTLAVHLDRLGMASCLAMGQVHPQDRERHVDRVRTEATMSGGAASLDQMEREVTALRTLNRIRDELMAAMIESAGHSAGD